MAQEWFRVAAGNVVNKRTLWSLVESLKPDCVLLYHCKEQTPFINLLLRFLLS